MESSSEPSTPTKSPATPKLLADSARGVLGSVWAVFRFLRGETRRRPGAFLMGILTITIAMLFVSVLLNAVSKVPFVFMRLAERNVGENDLVMQAAGSPQMSPSTIQQTSSPDSEGDSTQDNDSSSANTPLGSQGLTNVLLNFTEISRHASKIPEVYGIAPRWILPVDVSLNLGPLNPSESLADAYSVDSFLLGIDSKRESKIGLGRSWAHLAPLKKNEVFFVFFIPF